MENKKILFIDLECSNLAANFGYIICIGYKWNYEKKAKVISITDFNSHKKNPTCDKQLLQAFRPIYEAADIVVYHYGSKFDEPFLQTRYLMNDLPILTSVTSVDTWRIAKYKLKLNSNRLQTVLDALGCKYNKTPVDGKIWVKAISGDKSSIKYIIEHCYQDIMVLEEVYNKIKGLMTTHPVVTKLYKPGEACPTCGKDKGMYKNGVRVTCTKTYQRLSCKNCGACVKGELIK